LEAAVKERPRATCPGLDFPETVEVVRSTFAWRPGAPARILIKALSRFMRPLEQGSYEGRAIDGEPHRSSWVIASPLNVFVLPRTGYWRKIVLAARLRHTGEINVLELPAGSGSNGNGPGAGRLENLIWIQRESDVSLRLVPVARTSHQLSTEAAGASIAQKAYRAAPQNLIRRATSLARTFRTGRVKNCAPIVLSRWLSENPAAGPAPQSAALKVALMGNIESQRRACAGPPAIPVREVKRRVMADPVLASYLQEYALDGGTTREQVIGEAGGYLDEIASDYRVGVVRWFARAVDFMFDRFLTGLEVDRAGIKYLSECDSRSRLVLVCSHKSYIDPLLIGYTLFRSGMVPPQQAAGLNLNFFPVGWLLRHSGAFYLRRTFAGETLYREVFSAYVRYLLAENHIMVVYVEGTRSRDGKLARPRTGFLGILQDSLKMGICQEIMLVPVYLGYDKVPEEAAHVKEMAGGRKVSESVKGFGRIYKSINTRLGRAYVKFGKPMSMRSLLDEVGLQGAAQAACAGINSVTPLTARSVASCALLASGEDWVPLGEVERAAGALMGFAEGSGCLTAVDCDAGGVRRAIDWLASEGHVSPDEREGLEGFALSSRGRRFLEYNKNISLHRFLDASLKAIASRSSAGDDAGNGYDRETTDFLRDLLEEEFLFDPAAGPGCPPEGREVFASLIESYLECYLVASRAAGDLLMRPLAREDLVEKCLAEGERMLKDGAIRRQESVLKTATINAVRRFALMGALQEQRERVEGRADKVSYVRGPAFERLAEIEARLREILAS
jgi:1-acyl-sn-glycerol-3-phosphate acyltransferase